MGPEPVDLGLEAAEPVGLHPVDPGAPDLIRLDETDQGQPEQAERVEVNSAAISVTVRGEAASSCRMWRRVGSAAALKASVMRIG